MKKKNISKYLVREIAYRYANTNVSFSIIAKDLNVSTKIVSYAIHQAFLDLDIPESTITSIMSVVKSRQTKKVIDAYERYFEQRMALLEAIPIKSNECEKEMLEFQLQTYNDSFFEEEENEAPSKPELEKRLCLL